MSVLPKVMLPSAVLIATASVVNTTVLLKITSKPEVVKFTPAIIAALATVNALLKLESFETNVTPVPPAVKVVVPVIVPPPVTPFTVIVPEPAAVMFNAPVSMKPSSVLSRLKPTPAVPKNTFTPVLLVMLTDPSTLIAAPMTTSPALVMVSDVSGAELPTVPVKVTVPAPAVKVRACAPLSVLPKVMSAPAGEPPLLVVSTLELPSSVTPPVPKSITSAVLVMVAATFDAAPPVKFMPPPNANVSVVRLPKVTSPVLLKSMFATNVFAAPVILIVVAVSGVVMKSFT